MNLAIVKLEPCRACASDPGFGVLHNGCNTCVREYGHGPQQLLVRKEDAGKIIYTISNVK